MGKIRLRLKFIEFVRGHAVFVSDISSPLNTTDSWPGVMSSWIYVFPKLDKLFFEVSFWNLDAVFELNNVNMEVEVDQGLPMAGGRSGGTVRPREVPLTVFSSAVSPLVIMVIVWICVY